METDFFFFLVEQNYHINTWKSLINIVRFIKDDRKVCNSVNVGGYGGKESDMVVVVLLLEER